MSNAILTAALTDSDLPGAVKRALQVKADDIMEADPALTPKEAALLAIEEFHGITRDDLAATLSALEEAPEKKLKKPDTKRSFSFRKQERGPITGGLGSMLSK